MWNLSWLNGAPNNTIGYSNKLNSIHHMTRTGETYRFSFIFSLSHRFSKSIEDFKKSIELHFFFSLLSLLMNFVQVNYIRLQFEGLYHGFNFINQQHPNDPKISLIELYLLASWTDLGGHQIHYTIHFIRKMKRFIFTKDKKKWRRKK